MNAHLPETEDRLLTATSRGTVELADESAPGTLHILIVDDDLMVRGLLARILQHAHYHVICAIDGQEGWEALCAGSYNGMITDNDMPRLSGLDLLRKVRAVPSNLPVILISGGTSWEGSDVPGLLNPGAVLAKPFTALELLTQVSRCFDGSGSHTLELAT